MRKFLRLFSVIILFLVLFLSNTHTLLAHDSEDDHPGTLKAEYLGGSVSSDGTWLNVPRGQPFKATFTISNLPLAPTNTRDDNHEFHLGLGDYRSGNDFEFGNLSVNAVKGQCVENSIEVVTPETFDASQTTCTADGQGKITVTTVVKPGFEGTISEKRRNEVKGKYGLFLYKSDGIDNKDNIIKNNQVDIQLYDVQKPEVQISFPELPHDGIYNTHIQVINIPEIAITYELGIIVADDPSRLYYSVPLTTGTTCNLERNAYFQQGLSTLSCNENGFGNGWYANAIMNIKPDGFPAVACGTSGKCKLQLRNTATGEVIDDAEFTLYNTSVILTAQGDKVRGEPPENPLRYNMKSGSQVTLTLEGCESGEATFEWFLAGKGRNGEDNRYGTSGNIQKNGEGKWVYDAGNPSPFTFIDGSDKAVGTGYAVVGTCLSNNRIGETDIFANSSGGTGKETITIRPASPIADTLFFAVVQKLGFDTCYYIRIQDISNDEIKDKNIFIDKPLKDQVEGSAVDAAVNSCAGEGENGEITLYQIPSILAVSTRWGDRYESTIDMPDLYEGKFRIILYRPDTIDNNLEDDDKATDKSYFDFTVGQNTGIPKNLPCARNAIDQNKGTCTRFPTAFGQIFTEPGEFVGRVMTVFLGIGGAIALILIIRASYVLMISRGDPEKVEEGKEILTAAIVGLLFIIFAFVILEVITVDILKIPGFER